MEKLIILAGSAVINVLFSKGIALGLVLILFWIKGRQLKFNSEEWDNYFLELSQEKVKRYGKQQIQGRLIEKELIRIGRKPGNNFNAEKVH